jgi:manganese transport protein
LLPSALKTKVVCYEMRNGERPRCTRRKVASMRNGSNDGVGIDRPNDRPERAAADSRSLIGPAFVTAALVFGPGSITTASSIGASLGYSLLWVTVLAVVFMLVYADMGIRIGMAMQASPIEVMKEKWGRMVGVLVGTGGFLVTISFQAGNSAGASVAMNLLFGGNIALWAAFFTALAIVLLWLPDYYKSLERIMVGLIVIMLVAFLVTAIFAKPRVGALAQGFVPGIPAGGGLLIIALIGTTFSVVGAFYQAYLAQEKGWRRTEYGQSVKDTLAGIIILGAMTISVMIAAAAVLLPQGITVTSPTDMAKTLEPTIGGWASIVFAVGIFGASFSSLLGNATVGGALLSDAFGLGHRLGSTKVKTLITVVMVLGGTVAVLFGTTPVRLIVFAQALTIFVVPLVGLLMLLLASDRARMGSLATPIWKNILAILGWLALLATAVRLVIILFVG